MWLDRMAHVHFPFISTYSTLWSWACLQIYNIRQSLSYTQLNLNSKRLPIKNTCEHLPCFSKGLGPSWSSRVDFEWFWMNSRWFTAKLARSSGHNGGMSGMWCWKHVETLGFRCCSWGHSEWISCLLWSRSFGSCGLRASDPRIATNSDGKNSVNHLVKFTLKLLDISIDCNFHERSLIMDSMDTTNSSNMQIEVWKMLTKYMLCKSAQRYPTNTAGVHNGLRWNSTMDLLACLTVNISACDLDEDENPNSSLLHVLNVEAPPDSTMSAQSIETILSVILIFWNDHITFYHDVCNQCFSNSMSLPCIGIYRLLSEDQSPRPDLLLFVGQILVFLSLTRSEASFWEDHWCSKHSFYTISYSQKKSDSIDCEHSYEFWQILPQLHRIVAK